MTSNNNNMLTFGGHLEVLRKMLFRIIGVTLVLGVVIFCFKDITFALLLAPCNSDFATYQIIEHLCQQVYADFMFEPYEVQLINTELSSQFMTHLTTSVCLALLFASPYIVVELFNFIAPALYDNERRYSVYVAVFVYLLFIAGVVMSYYVIFPFSLRFLGTYQVAEDVVNQINLSSYISTFTTLTFLMGLVFQIPILSFFLAKMGILSADFMAHYRKYALLVIMIIAAVITPPDAFTMVLVTVPMYALYEVSILLVRKVNDSEKEA